MIMAGILVVKKIKKMTEFRVSKEFIRDLNTKTESFVKDALAAAEEVAKEKKQKTLLV
jgi:histone H3/H4